MGGVSYKTMAGQTLKIQQDVSTEAFVYSIQSADNEVLLAPAGNRKGLMIYNNSIFTMYIKFGAGVSQESFSVKLQPEATYEMSQNIMFSGDIYAVWDQADGSAQVTQLL